MEFLEVKNFFSLESLTASLNDFVGIWRALDILISSSALLRSYFSFPRRNQVFGVLVPGQ